MQLTPEQEAAMALPPPEQDHTGKLSFQAELLADATTLKNDWTKLVQYAVAYNRAPKVCHYDFDGLCAYGGLPGWLSQASVFRLSLHLRAWLVVQLLVALIVWFIVRGLSNFDSAKPGRRLMAGDDDDDGDDGRADAWSDTSRRLASTSDFQPIHEVTIYLNALVIFMLGLFIMLNLRRWWQFRMAQNKIVGASKNLACVLVALIPEPAYACIRDRINRYSVLGFRLLNICNEGNVTREHIRGLVEEEHLLTESEAKILERESTITEVKILETAHSDHGGSKVGGRVKRTESQMIDLDLSMVPYVWNCQMIHGLHHQGLIPTPLLMKMQQFCLECRNGIDFIQTQRNTQLPFPYVQMLAMLVHLSVLQGALRCGVLLAVMETPWSALGNVTMMILVNILYNGLLSMTAAIEDPFGDGIVDFPGFLQMLQMCKNFQYTESLNLETPAIQAHVSRTVGQELRSQYSAKSGGAALNGGAGSSGGGEAATVANTAA